MPLPGTQERTQIVEPFLPRYWEADPRPPAAFSPVSQGVTFNRSPLKTWLILEMQELGSFRG